MLLPTAQQTLSALQQGMAMWRKCPWRKFQYRRELIARHVLKKQQTYFKTSGFCLCCPLYVHYYEKQGAAPILNKPFYARKEWLAEKSILYIHYSRTTFSYCCPFRVGKSFSELGICDVKIDWKDKNPQSLKGNQLKSLGMNSLIRQSKFSILTLPRGLTLLLPPSPLYHGCQDVNPSLSMHPLHTTDINPLSLHYHVC